MARWLYCLLSSAFCINPHLSTIPLPPWVTNLQKNKFSLLPLELGGERGDLRSGCYAFRLIRFSLKPGQHGFGEIALFRRQGGQDRAVRAFENTTNGFEEV